jgi:site-specific recombinase XerD
MEEQEIVNTSADTLATITSRTRGYAEQAKAPATIRAYRSDWSDFATWCAGHDLPALRPWSARSVRYIATVSGAAGNAGRS